MCQWHSGFAFNFLGNLSHVGWFKRIIRKVVLCWLHLLFARCDYSGGVARVVMYMYTFYTTLLPRYFQHSLILSIPFNSDEMGDERLFIVFFKELPATLVEHFRRQFREAELTIHQSHKGVPVPRGWCSPVLLHQISFIRLTNKSYGEMRRWSLHLPIFPNLRMPASMYTSIPSQRPYRDS